LIQRGRGGGEWERCGAGAAGTEGGGRVWEVKRTFLYRISSDFGPSDLKIDARGVLEGSEVGSVRGRRGCVGRWEFAWEVGRRRLPCAACHARQRTIVCHAFSIRCTTIFFRRALTHNKQFFYSFVKFIKIIKQLKKLRKLTQIMLCCLLLIETSFEVKTQFE
jgi:hypothetical protein